MSGKSGDESRDGVALTNLDQPLFDGADATKRDLVDYLDAVRDRIIPVLEDRPLSVIRVHRGQEAFMQKNVPKYTPEWVRTVQVWAEASKREVSYALCNDRRTLLWFANQRAIEYHPTLVRAERPGPRHPSRARPRPARRRRVRDGGPCRAPRAPGARRRRARGRGQDERREGRARVRPDRRTGDARGLGRRDASHRGAGGERSIPRSRRRRSSRKTAAARCSSTRRVREAPP